MEANKAGEDLMPMFIQDLSGSSHIQCIGTVRELINNESFYCTLPILGDIAVELEKSNADICENMKVEFLGNLTIYLQNN